MKYEMQNDGGTKTLNAEWDPDKKSQMLSMIDSEHIIVPFMLCITIMQS